jgi:hypothetical protein
MSDDGETGRPRRPRPALRRWVPGHVRAACSLGVVLDVDADDDAPFVLEDAAADMLGWTRRELAMFPARQLIHPDDRERLDGPGWSGTHDQVPFVPIRVRVLSRDSRYWWTRWHLRRDLDDATVAVGDSVMRPAPDDGPAVGIWEWETESDTVTWSVELLDMFGFLAQSPATYLRALDVVLPEDRPSVARHAERAVACGVPFDVVFRSAAPGRRDRWFHATGRRSDHDGCCRLGGLVKDLNPACVPDRGQAIGYG